VPSHPTAAPVKPSPGLRFVRGPDNLRESERKPEREIPAPDGTTRYLVDMAFWEKNNTLADGIQNEPLRRKFNYQYARAVTPM